ncbi:30S ribosomal protein S1 [Tenuibacillus multivorans]|uniref:Small subunit ribosomal protein S1 n=2 Tax=Tenuibacillus multivorans TaxID=237069 RepID=A0A1H0CWK5_9BACI|nr:30S ribosomal protein S1 [Tenuibacillus multivorans]SDN62021.1 small subunit ribosomal protein S1 [Tenuibacillus multivorans]
MSERQDNQTLEVGAEVTGKILKLEEKQVVVDIGEKYDGIVPISELSHLHVVHPNEVLSEGDEVSFIVTKVEDEAIILSKKLKDQQMAWTDLKEKFEHNATFNATVMDIVNGGLVLDVGLRAFMPASQVESYFVENFDSYQGQILQVKVIEMDESKNRVILSHRAVTEEEQNAKRKETIQNIESGQVVEGKVQRITNFGAFIDLGGVDGLVHISQLSHDHVDKAEDVVNEGDTIKVKVLSVDLDTERIALSLKDTLPGPWDGIEEEFSAGDVVEGVVRRLVNFGAFVELKPGVEGLVHISQISKEHIGNPQEVLQEGQMIKVKILDISEGNKRISLSIKEAQEEQDNVELQKYKKEDDEHSFQLGDIIGDRLKDINK